MFGLNHSKQALKWLSECPLGYTREIFFDFFTHKPRRREYKDIEVK
jgi:hypothetical protein